MVVPQLLVRRLLVAVVAVVDFVAGCSCVGARGRWSELARRRSFLAGWLVPMRAAWAGPPRG
ncbi:hypothetical protein [Nocardioides sp. L-11A]|uniref:hypothetical protein n=1 Tax=Nocardioides sp. L-11A TaxID=3043848 RepID=UPI00249B3476|nr:hypothetical protein QJ852_06475 [Nocardioides sp. L-11A]